MNDCDESGESARSRLPEYAELGLIRGWMRHPTRDGHLLVFPCEGETIETASPREAELVCRALASAARADRPIGLTGISAMFPSAYDLDGLVRTAGELASGRTPAGLSAHHLDLARAAGRLIDLETVAGRLRGSMADGYDDNRANRVLGQLSDMTGLELVCVWAVHDSSGVHGDSQFYVEDSDRLYDLEGNLWEWLNGDPADSSTPSLPCDPGTWRGAGTELVASELPYHDGWRNYAGSDRCPADD